MVRISLSSCTANLATSDSADSSQSTSSSQLFDQSAVSQVYLDDSSASTVDNTTANKDLGHSVSKQTKKTSNSKNVAVSKTIKVSQDNNYFVLCLFLYKVQPLYHLVYDNHFVWYILALLTLLPWFQPDNSALIKYFLHSTKECFQEEPKVPVQRSKKPVERRSPSPAVNEKEVCYYTNEPKYIRLITEHFRYYLFCGKERNIMGDGKKEKSLWRRTQINFTNFL